MEIDRYRNKKLLTITRQISVDSFSCFFSSLFFWPSCAIIWDKMEEKGRRTRELLKLRRVKSRSSRRRRDPLAWNIWFLRYQTDPTAARTQQQQQQQQQKRTVLPDEFGIEARGDERLGQLAQVELEHVGDDVRMDVGQVDQVGAVLEGLAQFLHFGLDARHAVQTLRPAGQSQARISTAERIRPIIWPTLHVVRFSFRCHQRLTLL